MASYTPGKQIVLTRNPAWRQSADPVRHQYVSKVVVTLGTSSDQTVLADIQAGSQDLFLADLVIPPQSIAGIQAAHDERLHIWPSSNLNPYIIPNLRPRTPVARWASSAVRQAIEYAMDKAAIVKVNGGPAVDKICTSAIPPGNAGYGPTTRTPPPASRQSGQVQVAAGLAGYPRGLTLSYLYRTTAARPRSSSRSRAAWPSAGSRSRAGRCRAAPTSSPGQHAETTSRATGIWPPELVPGLVGNNGRTVIQPLFGSPPASSSTVNAGCYAVRRGGRPDHPGAEDGQPVGRRRTVAQAGIDAMNDAAIVPLISG